MARARISEHKAKQLLIGTAYTGISISGSADKQFATLDSQEKYVAKVDQGIKKRFHQGLVAINVTPKMARAAISAWEQKGFSKFLIEPAVAHQSSEEQYLSFERVRGGVQVVWTEIGGVDVETKQTEPTVHLVTDTASLQPLCEIGIPRRLIERALHLIWNEQVSFIEINPLLIHEGESILLDAAVLVDTAGAFFTELWSEEDCIENRKQYPEETAVARLQGSTSASLKLQIINPDGALFFLLSGGGGSIVVLDAAHEHGAGTQIGNYGEYSGGPTREETYLYTQQVLTALLHSSAPRKALVIAGGVANFTDVLKTFQGVIDALQEYAPALRKANTKVFVRRGGPNEAAGLAAMHAFLEKEGLFGYIYGSDTPITTSVIEAVAYISTSS